MWLTVATPPFETPSWLSQIFSQFRWCGIHVPKKDTQGLFSVNCRYLRKRKLALLSPNSSVQLPLKWACFYPVTSLLRDQQLLVVMHQALQKKRHVTGFCSDFHSHILKGEQRFLAFAPQLYIQSRDLRDLRGGTLTSWHCKTPPNNPICRVL